MKSNHLGLLLIIFTLTAIITIGGSLSLFISIPGLLAVLSIVLGALIFKFGISSFKYCRQSREYRNLFCNYGSSISINAGFLAAIIAFIQMFAQANWTDSNQVGLAVSLALTTTLYGFLLSLGFKLGMVPLEAKGQTKV